MRNAEQLPEAVNGWIGRKDFDALSDSEKMQVLEYLDREEYDALHETAKSVQGYYSSDRQIKAPDAVKRRLSSAIRADNNNKSVPLRTLRVWQMAASILLLVCFLAWFNKSGLNRGNDTVVVHDTLYREVPVTKVATVPDTIIVYRDKFPVRRELTRQSAAPQWASVNPVHDTMHVPAREEDAPIGIRTFRPEDLSRESIQGKGKTLQEDELPKQIGQFTFANT